ncbi:hypothetical protein DN824_20430 [Stutzerimonas nosocomialis]|uniref:hypothetical protein n=1 Tax=Stutzerimonas nosocomialis TaxID=1056496 RepID=UPI0011088E9E|nr:hypothetical protein [Stutzerimonas nosocomialis]TLX54852.1 hypothetical protein DN824_20430 [Stutzerimonas nosocomialis]
MTAARDLARLVPFPAAAGRYVWTPNGWLLLAEFAEVATRDSAAHTAALADAGKYLRFMNGSAASYTVAPQSSVAWADNTEITIRRAAAADLTLAAGAGVTLNPPSGGTLVLTNNMTVTLKRVGVDVWDVIGQTVAA